VESSTAAAARSLFAITTSRLATGDGFASAASGTPSSRSCVDEPFARIPSPEVAFA
jgi:hypothetical protein